MLVYYPALVTHCQRRLAAKFQFVGLLRLADLRKRKKENCHCEPDRVLIRNDSSFNCALFLWCDSSLHDRNSTLAGEAVSRCDDTEQNPMV